LERFSCRATLFHLGQKSLHFFNTRFSEHQLSPSTEPARRLFCRMMSQSSLGFPWTNSAPSSTGMGNRGSRLVCTRPPTLSRASTIVTCKPAFANRRAAAKPANPAPITRTDCMGASFLSWTRYLQARETAFPLDIPKEYASLICTSQRRQGGANEIGSPSRHSRPHDSQGTRCSGAVTRLWNSAP